MNSYIKTAVPFFCLTITACAHLANTPESSELGAIPASRFQNVPSDSEIQVGMKKRLRADIADVEYSSPPMKVCWGLTGRWSLRTCGWGVGIRTAGYANSMALFSKPRLIETIFSTTINEGVYVPPSAMDIPIFGQPNRARLPGWLGELFVVRVDSAPATLDWVHFILDVKAYEARALWVAESKRIYEERAVQLQAERARALQAEAAIERAAESLRLRLRQEREAVEAARLRTEEKRVAKETATLAAGAALCGKTGLDELCYLSLAPADFLRNFGGSFTQRDKAAFYNAWRLGAERQKQEIARQQKEDESRRQAQEELKAKEESARQRNQVYQPVQIIYPDNSRQQQMTNFLLLNQIQRSFQPRTTNCTTFGSNMNCTGY